MFPIRDHNPSRRVPLVTWGLIGLNVAVFVSYAEMLGDARALGILFHHWGMVPARLSMGQGGFSLLTSQFLHAGVLHLGMNMLFLYIFGDNIEDAWGHVPFLLFYLTCGVAAAGLHFLSDPMSPIPMVGASGAVAGVLGGYMLMYPKARVDVFVFLVVVIRILPFPAWFVLGLWFLMQILGGVAAPPGAGGVAYWAHAGGFLAGAVLSLPIWLARGGPAYWRRFQGAPPHPEARYRLQRTHVPRAGRRRNSPPAGPWSR